MLMAITAAAMRTESTMHPSSSFAGSIISPAPWHNPAVPVATHQQQHQATVLFDPADLTTPSPSPPPPRNHHHQQLRPGPARRPSGSKRRPRPSRKAPTTYITADPASFRRMVHQVTGADDLPPPLAPRPGTYEETTLCRPMPSRAAAAGALTRMLPTLDTSAFLLGISGSGSARTTTGPGPGPALEVDVGAGGGVGALGGVGTGYDGDCGASAGGFPTLESWDALLY